MSRSVQQTFGNNTATDFSDQTDPVLSIRWSDIKEFAKWDTPPTSDDASGEKWLNAILMKAKADSDTVTDQSNNITIERSFKTFGDRQGVEKIGHTFNVTVYVPDESGDSADSDNL